MRIVLQRVGRAAVEVGGETVGAVERGYLLLLGVEPADGVADIDWLVRKIVGLRLFPDDEGKMNGNVIDIGGSALVISQFTLHASCKKGNRPSFTRAADPEHAEPTYEKFCAALSEQMPVQRGIFGADMQVSLVNDGPVTIWLDSHARDY